MCEQSNVLANLFHKDNLVVLVKALDARSDKLAEDLSWIDDSAAAIPVQREMKLSCAVLGLLRDTYGSSYIDSILKPTLLDSERNPLIPGRCYCLASYNGDTENDVSYGSLAWSGSDGKLYNANYADCEGEELDEDYDFLVLQAGEVNPAFIAS